MTKIYGYTFITKDGLSTSGSNIKASSEVEVFQRILDDPFNTRKKIVSITVIEQGRGED